MTNDIPLSSQVRSEDEAQGQKMTIYMPQGAVIIERSELETPAEPLTQNLSEEAQVSRKTENESVQSLGAVINIYTGDETHSLREQSHSKVLATDTARVNEQQVLLRISEMLDVITKRLDQNAQPIVQTAQPIDPVIESTNPVEDIASRVALVLDDHKVKTSHSLNGHHFDWLHFFNLMYIAVILFTLLLPSGLHSLLHVQVFPALTSYEAAGIQKGDLLIEVESEASTLAVGDVLALHDTFLGSSEVVQVSEISAPQASGVVTFAISPRVGQRIDLSHSLSGDSEIYKVVKSVPALGSAKEILDSFFVQFFVGISVLLLNTVVHFRRHRRSKSTP